MEIIINRVFKSNSYTVGHLYLDGVKVCDTLEDMDRDLNNDGDLNDASETKVWGQTAIPKGKYSAVVYFWNKINRKTLWIQNVPGFEGILIHGGTTAESSHGCVLVGFNTEKGKLTNSKIALDRIMDYITIKKPEKITIIIK